MQSITGKVEWNFGGIPRLAVSCYQIHLWIVRQRRRVVLNDKSPLVVLSYSQELPRRFRKDIVKAATKRSATTGFVSAEGIESVLSNIGAEDQMSRSEIELMLREVSGDQDRCAISVEEMLNLLSPRSVAWAIVWCCGIR
jgi:KaiC/GvpD/RAD55 family RecA-like ATPase